MSVKNFKFVSPGVFINEIDNSFIPQSPGEIGPVVIGRSSRGLAMQPIKVESFAEFVEAFGDVVPGAGGGDISRDGNNQSPMYGTYAAKAFLNANVAPLTYIRLLGQQETGASSDGIAGWQTAKTAAPATSQDPGNGGSYGLWLFPSQSTSVTLGTGMLGAVWYLNHSASIRLSGTVHMGSVTTASVGTVIGTDSDKLFTVLLSSELQGTQKFKFGFDDDSEKFIRKRFNTNPQLCSSPGSFYTTASSTNYWLGETFEQALRDSGSLASSTALGVILPLQKGTNASPGDGLQGPHNMRQASREAIAGWFIGQDSTGDPATFNPLNAKKLFRLKGRGHGEWLHKNLKVSIENIRQSTTNTSDYGTFSLVLRLLNDTDNNVQIVERFDNLSLDSTSPSYVARKIGDKYTAWDSTNRRLKTYGDYDNQSNFVYVDPTSFVEDGMAGFETLLPFGYYGPPRMKNTTVSGSQAVTASGGSPVYWPSTGLIGSPATPSARSGSWPLSPGAVLTTMAFSPSASAAAGSGSSAQVSGAFIAAGNGTLAFPEVQLRNSASDGGLSVPADAYWGLYSNRSANSTRAGAGLAQCHGLPYRDFSADPSGQTDTVLLGATAFAYVFTMNDLCKSGSSYYYQSGAYAAENGNNVSNYQTLLNAGINRFTAPFWGGFDGFDIKVPDPMYNKGIPGAGGSGTGTASDTNDYAYHTWKRAIDTVADPEALEMNLLVAPGLTVDSLTGHMIDVCGERADALALVDLPSVYVPSHETYFANKNNRIGTTPISAANTLKARRLDSSYGATFYPWVQTRDANSGRLVWIPPSVAMLGVLASSQKASELWFAPAGFNRGGLSQGAAGIPVVNVSERLTSKERDTLYESNINPIASFPSSGIVVFGQKTLQESQSALDRINVRRLVIYLKKQISILSTKVLFEQNVQATWNRFKSLIEPLLANTKVNFGITDYRLILDETTTTPDLIDQNILYAKIMVKPARAIEYIAIDFVIASTGASFDD